MINFVWAIMVIVSIITAFFSGNLSELNIAVYKGGSSAIELCISLAAIMAIWGGIMRIAEKSGATIIIGKVLSPLVNLIFIGNELQKETKDAISMSMMANMLGLGNAATPLGINAMKKLHNDGGNRDVATRNMITFVVLNTASIQLIPTTISAMRMKYGAENPMDIAIPLIIVSILALIMGLAFNKVMSWCFERKK